SPQRTQRVAEDAESNKGKDNAARAVHEGKTLAAAESHLLDWFDSFPLRPLRFSAVSAVKGAVVSRRGWGDARVRCGGAGGLRSRWRGPRRASARGGRPAARAEERARSPVPPSAHSSPVSPRPGPRVVRPRLIVVGARSTVCAPLRRGAKRTSIQPRSAHITWGRSGRRGARNRTTTAAA